MNLKHSAELVAKIRGAAQQRVPHKLIAKAANVELVFVHEVSKGRARKGIEPDRSIVQVLSDWFKSTNSGAIQEPEDAAS